MRLGFFADWCAACKELGRETYPAQAVISQASEGPLLNLELDATTSDAAPLERLGVEGRVFEHRFASRARSAGDGRQM
jgi:thiol:disulfide interchange protein DsbD